MEDSIHNLHGIKMAGQAVDPAERIEEEFLIACSSLSPTRRREIYDCL
jgi:hypothetical protein